MARLRIISRVDLGMLEGRLVRLRAFELSDVDALLEAWNKTELRNWLGAGSMGPLSRDEEEEWIRSTWKDKRERARFTFAIESIKDKELLGTISLFNCLWTNRSTTLGVYIHKPENRGKGYGTEAIRLIIDFAFRHLNLNRVQLDVFDFNERAQKCYRKIGFKEVGRRRQARFVDGKYRDEVTMDILREEWTKD